MVLNIDVEEYMRATIQSGLVVSGNSDLILTASIGSGDLLNSFAISGNTDLIVVSHGRTDTEPMTGGANLMNEICDVDIIISYPTSRGGDAHATLQTRINDLATTIADASWVSGSGRPVWAGHEASKGHELASRSKTHWRFRYLH